MIFQFLSCTKSDFNQYLSFDGWQVVRQGQNITFQVLKAALYQIEQKSKS